MTYTPVNGTRPMVMDFAPQAPDVNQMSKDGSFTDVFKGQTGDKAETKASNPKTTGKENAGESLKSKKGPAKEIKETNEATETKQAEPMDTETKETVETEVKEAITEAISEIAEEFEMDPEEIIDIIEKMGLQVADILVPENLTQVVLEVAGETEPMALVTDENLNNFVSELNEELRTVVDNLAAENNVTRDEVIATAAPAFENVMAEATKEEDNDIKVTFEVKEDKTSKETKTNDLQNEGKEVQVKEDSKISEVPETKSSKDNKNEAHDGAAKGNILLDNIANKVTETVVETTDSTFTYTEARQVMDQVIERIHVAVKPDTSDIEMMLHPASLGAVNVHLSSKEGMVTAQFTTQNEQVKAILEAQMIELKETFEARGVKVDNIEVSVQTNAFAQE
ncbi:MAG: flagellar hook-length control protein FliK, partial [Lachnospiraceae bacterium]|nr:flagellar hook-length control protein FliK [Lachnospiraceae bacterium]